MLLIQIQLGPNKTKNVLKMSPLSVLSCFYASSKVAVFYHTSLCVNVCAPLGRCVLFLMSEQEFNREGRMSTFHLPLCVLCSIVLPECQRDKKG